MVTIMITNFKRVPLIHRELQDAYYQYFFCLSKFYLLNPVLFCLQRTSLSSSYPLSSVSAVLLGAFPPGAPLSSPPSSLPTLTKLRGLRARSGLCPLHVPGPLVAPSALFDQSFHGQCPRTSSQTPVLLRLISLPRADARGRHRLLRSRTLRATQRSCSTQPCTTSVRSGQRSFRRMRPTMRRRSQKEEEDWSSPTANWKSC